MSKSNNKRIAKNTVYLYIRMIIVLLINLYTTRVLLKSLGVTDYGIYNVVGGVVSFMSFIQSAMSNGFQRYFNIALGRDDDDEFVSLFSVSISVQLIICIVFLLIAETIGLWFLNSQMTIPTDRIIAANFVYQSAIIVFLLTMIISPYNAVIIAYEKMDLFAVISIINVILKLFIAYVLVYFAFDRLILYSILTIIVQLILLFSCIIPTINLNKRISIVPKLDWMRIKDVMSFSGWNLFGSLAHSAKGQGLNIVLNMFFDPAVNAARGVAFQVSAGLTQCYYSFQTAARPQIMKLYAQTQINEMLDLTNRISRFSFMLLWMLDLPLLFTSEYFLRLWLGENVPSYAPLFTKIVLITILIECFATPISNLVHATGQMKVFQLVTSAVIVLVIPLAYLVLKFGLPPPAALYCSLFMAPLIQLTRLLLVRNILPFSISAYLKEAILPSIKVALVSCGIMLLINRLLETYIHPIVLSIIGFFIALIAIYILGCTRKERIFIWSKIINIVKR